MFQFQLKRDDKILLQVVSSCDNKCISRRDENLTFLNFSIPRWPLIVLHRFWEKRGSVSGASLTCLPKAQICFFRWAKISVAFCVFVQQRSVKFEIVLRSPTASSSDFVKNPNFYNFIPNNIQPKPTVEVCHLPAFDIRLQSRDERSPKTSNFEGEKLPEWQGGPPRLIGPACFVVGGQRWVP